MKKIHLIGNAHLDPVWLWRWQEGFAEIKATFRSALDRMKEFDSFIFTSACASYYMWIEKCDPKMFEEIKARVKEGRWCIAGGMFVQPDCNMPSGESFARHMLISQRYFKEKFGIIAKTGYNVDSFGHNGNMPMLLRNGGMENYVFMRPQKHEKELSESLFIWESDDGSRVKAYRIPFSYSIWISCPDRKFEDSCFGRIASLDEPCDQMAFYGVGNHGGGATIELLDWMSKNLDERFVYSSPDTYFETADEAALPTVHDDLQYHAKGCYSAYTKIKQDNRRCENALGSAECISVLANKLVGTEYPADDLRRAWMNVLFNQFHDILCGCSVKEAYADAAMSHGESLTIAQRAANLALSQIAWNIDTVGDNTPHITKNGFAWVDANGLGTPLVVFNPLAHEVTSTVQLDLCPDSVVDPEGNLMPLQNVRASRTLGNDKFDRLIKVTVPAMGYKVFRCRYNGEKSEYENPFTCTDNAVDNGIIRITFDKSCGELSSVYDMRSGNELLGGNTSAFLVDETNADTWAHGICEFRDVTDLCTCGTVKIIESGPVRATVRCEQKLANSTVVRDYSISSDSDVITARTRVDFREKHRMLKFSMPVNVKNGQVLCEIPFGKIERPTDGTEQVCGKWFLLREGETGLCVANDSKHSFDAKDNVLTLTVIRGAVFADHVLPDVDDYRDEFCRYMDQGIHEFEYSVFPYTSVSDAVRRAAELNNKPRHITDTFHKGTLPLTYSGVSVDADNVQVTAVKRGEDGGTAIRLYETEGRDTDVNITLFGNSFKLTVGHDSVVTAVISADGKVKITDFLE